MMEMKCVVREPRQPSGDQIISPLFPPTAREKHSMKRGGAGHSLVSDFLCNGPGGLGRPKRPGEGVS